MEAITFPNGQITMAGSLYLPEGLDRTTRHAAIVVVHPGGGVKEQAAGLYASKLAEQGFVALAFDASFQGDSGGEPHHLEDPYARVDDVRAAVDHMQTLDFVDPERIGTLGICAGAGYSVNAAMTDYRIKALTTVSAVNIGTNFRRGWYGTDSDAAAVPTLQAVARQRTAEASQGAEPTYLPYVPAEPDENTPRDLVEAGEYYLTPRAQHPNAKNKFLFTKSVSRIFTFDAFHLVEDLLTQPLLVVAGSEAGSLWMSTELHGRARTAKKLRIVEGGTHMDFYDVPKYVDQAIAEAVPFYAEHLAAEPADQG
ncbi:alpha/beta hydrolase [Streptomyces acidiscabies]|uniref:Alpha/beta hydrolase n=1 Tax=Streptomyces acidiscabies TaxID=42234 RepID=A0AAP6BM69_9ACTN|nr:alpha/beta hydrolase [Streptomyces acidiscabies]MBP5937256.1 alpha/beta hydrolase [Streptomyces sp. LBUM 1476]MBZ3914686.1 alpha/beta hydrolase [Streptomyces acidiscabies]MDX2967245.1 alpha/beta hydrolase [Streptomyces acidiscabies]MDX3020600.1 alpha/beta hydrolase [Streptomyces acidiscabies]MDX3795807.1 alpha/beta hydrolase [Streptomyces acidiscabies]